MSLISMAVHDTEDNNRTELTYRTLVSIGKTVDLGKHRMFIIDNGSCPDTKTELRLFERNIENVEVITLPENVGTARAVNLGWKRRNPGEHCIKMDNDVEFHFDGWVDAMDEAIEREPQIGICGLKRKDCWENPSHPDKFYRSELIMLPHKPGEPWIIAERVHHVMGTCQMYNSDLLDKIGYLWQPSLYGFDDVLAAYRSEIAGFINVFLPHIRIDHIDPGGTEYCGWKHRESGKVQEDIIKIVDEYIAGTRPIYHDCE